MRGWKGNQTGRSINQLRELCGGQLTRRRIDLCPTELGIRAAQNLVQLRAVQIAQHHRGVVSKLVAHRRNQLHIQGGHAGAEQHPILCYPREIRDRGAGI